jgi:hypothetical protein
MFKTITFERSIATENPMSAEDLRSAERVLARLIAAAYAADHPELFGDQRGNGPIMGGGPVTPAQVSTSGVIKKR